MRYIYKDITVKGNGLNTLCHKSALSLYSINGPCIIFCRDVKDPEIATPKEFQVFAQNPTIPPITTEPLELDRSSRHRRRIELSTSIGNAHLKIFEVVVRAHGVQGHTPPTSITMGWRTRPLGNMCTLAIRNVTDMSFEEGDTRKKYF